MVTKQLVIASGDGWEGLYEDGILIYQDHKLKPSNILRILGYQVKRVEVDFDWLDDLGELPLNLSEVVING